MIVVTSDTIPGRCITKTHGLCRGNTIRARHVGRDIVAHFRNLVGGEVKDYTKLMAEAREQAIDRMVDEAHGLGANAVVTLRFASAEIMQGATEFLAYGTAVTISPDGGVAPDSGE